MPDLILPLLQALLKPTMVHSLPGRVRIHIPALRSAKRRAEEIQALVEQIVAAFPGVNEVSLSFATGNVLVTYDVSKVSQDQLLAAMSGIVKTMLIYRRRLLEANASTRTRVVEYLTKAMTNSNQTHILEGQEIELPDDIWT